MPLTRYTSDEDIVPLFEDIFPSGKGLLVMLKVYLDRGKKTDASDSIVCVAATVFKPTPYKQFVRPWNRMLKAWGAKAFHATDFYPGGGEFKRKTPERQRLYEEDSKRIPVMIGEHVHRVDIMSFRPEEFAAEASQKWKDRFGTKVHSLSVQLCMVSLGLWRQKNCPSEEFAYIQESGDPEEGDIAEAVRLMRRDEQYGRVIKVSSFTTVDKGKARGLESADFVAWHWNKQYMDKFRHGDDTQRKDLAAFMRLSHKKVASAFVTGKKLREFFSVCDQI